MPRKPKVPPLCGRWQAAELLGMRPENMDRNLGDKLPPPLQERVPGMMVDQTPLWTVVEIQELAAWWRERVE